MIERHRHFLGSNLTWLTYSFHNLHLKRPRKGYSHGHFHLMHYNKSTRSHVSKKHSLNIPYRETFATIYSSQLGITATEGRVCRNLNFRPLLTLRLLTMRGNRYCKWLWRILTDMIPPSWVRRHRCKQFPLHHLRAFWHLLNCPGIILGKLSQSLCRRRRTARKALDKLDLTKDPYYITRLERETWQQHPYILIRGESGLLLVIVMPTSWADLLKNIMLDTSAECRVVCDDFLRLKFDER